MINSRENNIFKLVLTSMFLALALVLPFLTGQIQQIGNALCPMHYPVFLCAFFCGPWYAMLIGFIAPLLRFALFGMPPIVPMGVSMSFELATYGLVCGLLYQKLKGIKGGVYISLIISMLCGRIVWGIVRVILYGIGQYEFSWSLFITGGFITSIPGMILQIIIIPAIVITLNRYIERL